MPTTFQVSWRKSLWVRQFWRKKCPNPVFIGALRNCIVKNPQKSNLLIPHREMPENEMSCCCFWFCHSNSEGLKEIRNQPISSISWGHNCDVCWSFDTAMTCRQFFKTDCLNQKLFHLRTNLKLVGTIMHRLKIQHTKIQVVSEFLWIPQTFMWVIFFGSPSGTMTKLNPKKFQDNSHQDNLYPELPPEELAPEQIAPVNPPPSRLPYRTVKFAPWTARTIWHQDQSHLDLKNLSGNCPGVNLSVRLC